MKRILTVALIMTTLCLTMALGASGNVEKREYVCMMQDMVLTRPGIAIQYQGKTYYGCCEMCQQKIKNEPGKYTKAVDLVSKKAVDKAEAFIYGIEGTAYYFSSEANRKSFAENPQKFVSPAR